MVERVNVLLHGIFGYVFNSACIEAYVPAVSGHIYKVTRSKSLEKAKDLPRSNFRLIGVKSGCAFSPDPKKSPVVRIKKNTTIDEFGKRFCKISLPYPSTFEGPGQLIWAMDSYKVGSIFSGRDSHHCNSVQPYPSMHAFVYERDRCPLRFEMGDTYIDLDDLPSDTPVGITNLHIWCTTPPMDMDGHGHTPDGHLRRGFAALVDLFPLLETTIQIPDGFTPVAAPESRPYGVECCDVDPGRDGCAHFGHVNCHYANLLAVEE
jgi:hypothetical protein